MTFEQQLATGQDYLMQNSPELALFIRQHGDCRYSLRDNYFQTLVGSIISQQLSVKATANIRGRLEVLLGGSLEQVAIQEADFEALKSVGLSRNKATYIQRLAHEYTEEDFHKIDDDSDEEVLKQLTNFAGIGEWTAQMFLMFSLGRLDILPIKDVGLRNGVKVIYGLDELSDEQLLDIGQEWQPYRSIATWYAWRATDSVVKI